VSRRPPGEPPLVLATAGGGEDGAALLETFVAAASGAPWRAAVVAGPLASSDARDRLRALAERAGVEYHTFLPDLADRLGTADALVCMGGYNTLAEALVRGTPTVCVPRVRPRTEQLIRARAFARLGLLHVLEPDELTPVALRRSVQRALRDERRQLRERAHATLGFDGARAAADRTLHVLRARPEVGVA
jgi:predicted glycosyltransferase